MNAPAFKANEFTNALNAQISLIFYGQE